LDLRTVKLLNDAIQNPELLGTITPALAANLGVIPLQTSEDYVCVGHVPGMCRDCLKFLERYYGKEVVAVPLDDGLARSVIFQVYLKGKPINHDTFPVPDYLLMPEYESKLLHEKRDDIGPVSSGLPKDEVVFLETSYRSLLVSLDSAESEEQQIDSDDVPFKITPGGPLVLRDLVSDDVLLVERRNYSYSGSQDRHGILREDVRSLPHVIHPSELQVTQIRVDGSLGLFVYDRVERVAVGSTAQFTVPYYFISFGCRYRRQLVLTIHRLCKFKRDKIVYTGDALPWDNEDLERWLCPA
jgi:hypothetical protein